MKINEKEPVFSLSKMPPVWGGFLFALVFLLVELLFLGENHSSDIIISLHFISFSGCLFWLACVYQFHKILGELSGYNYPISPRASVGWHFFPLYNIFWIFYWPSELSHFIKIQGFVKILPGGIIGVFILLSLIIYRLLDGALGLSFLFGVTLYMASKFKLHIERIGSKFPNGIPTVVLEDYKKSYEKKLSPIEKKNNGKVYTPDEVSEILMVPTNKVREWLRSGKLNGIKAGRLWRVHEKDLKTFLKRLEKD